LFWEKHLNWLHIVILILATWRISSLLANEAGPAGVLDSLRHWLGIRHNDIGERYSMSAVGDEILCQWCTSLWIGAVLGLLYWLWPLVTVYVTLPLALSTGTILIMTSKGLQVFLRSMRDK
jgi:hypothetical protein